MTEATGSPLEKGGDVGVEDAKAGVVVSGSEADGDAAAKAAGEDSCAAKHGGARVVRGSQRLVFDADAARNTKPAAASVVVVAVGSHYVRYGLASAPVPRKLRSLVAFPRRAAPTDGDEDAVADAAPPLVSVVGRRAGDVAANATPDAERFDRVVDTIAADMALHERRRGGGKPIPWDMDVEPVDVPDAAEDDAAQADAPVGPDKRGEVLVGRRAEKGLLADERERSKYDYVAPVHDGRMAWEQGASAALVREALDAIFSVIGIQLLGHLPHDGEAVIAKDGGTEANGDDDPGASKKKRTIEATTHVAIIVPDTSDRADIEEFVSSAFRAEALRAAAVFVHHNSVSCALGAGLSTCAVVDIGHTSTAIACVEEGCVLGDSRVHLQYGAHCIVRSFERLLRKSGVFDEVFREQVIRAESSGNDSYPGDSMDVDTGMIANGSRASFPWFEDDLNMVMTRACEQMCGFNVDENDTLSIVMSRAPSSGKMFRIKCGVGIRAVPAYGLIYPELFEAISGIAGLPKTRAVRAASARNTNEDNYTAGLFDDIKRSAMVAAAVPFGRFANESSACRLDESSTINPVKTTLVDAVVWSVNKAVESSVLTVASSHRGPELKRRYFNSVLLAGGGSSIDGIALALESQLKRTLARHGITVNDVTIIDGAKGKGDEELAAASALVKSDGDIAGLDDDGDPASLPWKGGAVIVEADAVKDSWVYRDEWESRGVRVLRERVPFYW